jgi:hypothetical protein
MKKTVNINIVILGILSLVLFGGCMDILKGPPSGLQEPSPGTGRVLLSIGSQMEGARTFMPAAGNYQDLSYSFEFTAEGKAAVSGSLTMGTGSAELEAGTWDLTITGRDSGGAGILRGSKTGIVIIAGQTEALSVTMGAFTEAGTGTLAYSISFPDDVIKGTLRVYGWDTGAEQGTALDLLSGAAAGSAPGTKTAGGTLTLPAGYYRIALELAKPDGIVRRTDIAHIYPEMNTPADYVLGAGDFNQATVDSAQTSLAGALASINGPAAGSTYVFFLAAGNEDMAAANISYGGVPVTIIIDGGGRAVTLTNTGSLITVGTNVSLVLRNLSLRGRGLDVDNDAALVTVESGGRLELGTGAAITANKNYSSSSSHGGGVWVSSNASFTMSGGEVSGNTASSSADYSFGGGVCVYGTFTMSGGEVSGNTASSSYSFGGGGGVYVSYNASFTMSGGEVSGNTASGSSSSHGGGVYVSSNASFTMNGGEVSHNTASSSNSSSYGGGVDVSYNASFTMSGGEVSHNTASSSADYGTSGGGVSLSYNASFTMSGGEVSHNTASSGGGVEVSNNSSFTMSGGKVSGNTASSGGGVDVHFYGSFTMSGGEISGNTASSSYYSRGGGVHVSNTSSFTMNGGEVSGNTASSGEGVYVLYDGGTFTMSGGARVNVNNPVCLYADDSDCSSLTIGGEFTGPAGPVAMIDLYAFSNPIDLWPGKAVLKLGYNGDLSLLRDRFTLGNFVSGDTTTPIIGYEIAPNGTLSLLLPSSGIGNITYSSVSGGDWTLEADGRRKSPAIGHNSSAKTRVSFTSAAPNSWITVQLDVSSESGYDYAFIGALDNPNAAYNVYYRRISGTDTAGVAIPVPTPGGHFIDIGYRKNVSASGGSDCAWFKLIE